MWRLFNHLLGWHYVHAKNSATDIVRRIRVTKAGRPYFVYFDQHLVFLDEVNGWTVTPLTIPAVPTEKQIEVEVRQ
jgi:hypothetical protein